MLRHKRILEQINKWDLLENFTQTVEVQHPADNLYPALKGKMFVMSEKGFDDLLDQVVEFTYHETFNVIKRKVNSGD